jgi:hypothetical protein
MQANGLPGTKPCEQAISTLQALLVDCEASKDHAAHARSCLALEQALRDQHATTTPTSADPRPHLQHLLQILDRAKTDCVCLLGRCIPPDLPVGTQLPMRELLADVLCRIAAVQLQYAEEMFSAHDAHLCRPAFPLVGSADASPVAAYLDSTLEAAQAERYGRVLVEVSHSHQALLSLDQAKRLTSRPCIIALCNLIASRVHALDLQTCTQGASATTWPELVRAASSRAQALQVVAGRPSDTRADVSRAAQQAGEQVPAAMGELHQFGGSVQQREGGADGENAAPSMADVNFVDLDPSAVSNVNAAISSTQSRPEWSKQHSEMDLQKAMLVHGEAISNAEVAMKAYVTQHNWRLASQAAQLLAQLHGERAPVDMAAAVSLWRACNNTAQVLEVSQQVLPPQSAERLFDKQLAKLGGPLSTPDSQTSVGGMKTAYARAAAVLGSAIQASSAQEMLHASMAALPCHVRVVTLEVDEASSMMCLACVQHGATSSASARGPAAAGGPLPIEATVHRARLDTTALACLRLQLAQWSKALLADVGNPAEENRPGTTRTMSAAVALDCSPQATVMLPLPDAGGQGPNEHSVPERSAVTAASEWRALLAALEHILDPFLSALSAAAADVWPATADEPSGKGKAAKSQPAPPVATKAAVVLCLADCLAPFPLEALAALSTAASVSRDLSLQALAQRTSTGTEPARASLSMATQQHSVQVADAFRTQVLSVHGPSWSGKEIKPDSKESAGEQVKLLQAASVFIFCSHERMPQRFPLSCLSSANLTGMKLALLFDNMLTSESAQTLAILQSRGSKLEQALWQQERLGAMLLQRGARCCMLSRYPETQVRGIRACTDALTAVAAGESVAAALSNVGRTRAESLVDEPWLAYSMLTMGLPHMTVDADKGVKTGKKK